LSLSDPDLLGAAVRSSFVRGAGTTVRPSVQDLKSGPRRRPLVQASLVVRTPGVLARHSVAAPACWVFVALDFDPQTLDLVEDLLGVTTGEEACGATLTVDLEANTISDPHNLVHVAPSNLLPRK